MLGIGDLAQDQECQVVFGDATYLEIIQDVVARKGANWICWDETEIVNTCVSFI